MNRRKEDRLIKMAFGELSGLKEPDARHDKDAEVLKTYADLRKSLNAAKEIPQHQLSNERLRHAILGVGLNHKTTSDETNLGWLWNSLGVCALIAVLTFALSQHRPTAEPHLNLPGLDQVASKEFSFKGDLTMLKPGLRAMVQPKAKISGSAYGYRIADLSDSVVHNARHRKMHRHTSLGQDPSVDPNWQVLSFEGSDGPGLSTASLPVESGKNEVGGGSGASRLVEKKTGSEPVVVIDQDQDNDTGARAAREIASKNIVVGG